MINFFKLLGLLALVTLTLTLQIDSKNTHQPPTLKTNSRAQSATVPQVGDREISQTEATLKQLKSLALQGKLSVNQLKKLDGLLFEN
jgi:hypothetical protein